MNEHLQDLKAGGRPMKKWEIEMQKKDKEIERLNNELENVKAYYETEAEAKYYEFIDNHESKLQQRINKAIEYIENIQTPTYMVLEDICDLLDILKGDDKE